ncbi:UNVERIFIED_CONTAM: hypothetical protein HDU68_007769 [Siphonaria sp. JEL0065]|nr:hypothetical protein HDU68_007769 [Siphonaria sp. JEL0065]
MGASISRSIQQQQQRKREKSVARETRKEAGAAPLSVVASSASQAAEDQLPSGRPSLASSINEGVAATWRPDDADNRRRYHAVETSDYVLPNDDREQTRLELQHRMLRYAFGSDAICPDARKLIKKHGTKVLDIGCANGAWMDSLFSAGHINCEYHGVDIAPDAFEFGTVCSAKIVVGNVLERLPYEDNTFDYVHQRLLVLGIPKDKWTSVIKEIIRVTKPGGWIELVEVDSEFYDIGPASNALFNPMFSVLEKRGLDICAGSNLLKNAVAAGGLINIGVKPVSIPLGWNGELGRLHAKDVREASLSVAPFMSKALGVTNEEFTSMLEECYKEWGKTRAFANYHCLWAQKL